MINLELNSNYSEIYVRPSDIAASIAMVILRIEEGNFPKNLEDIYLTIYLRMMQKNGLTDNGYLIFNKHSLEAEVKSELSDDFRFQTYNIPLISKEVARICHKVM